MKTKQWSTSTANYTEFLLLVFRVPFHYLILRALCRKSQSNDLFLVHVKDEEISLKKIWNESGRAHACTDQNSKKM